MASNIAITSGSPCIGSPITLKATSVPLVGSISFHIIKFVVHAALYDSGGFKTDPDFIPIQMSMPVTTVPNKSETAEVDISSALRAVADKYEYRSILPIVYPLVKWNVEIYDEYMVNGTVKRSASVFYPGNDAEGHATYLKSIFGTYSELERYLSVDGYKMAQYFSRKPKNATEVVCVGDEFVVPQPYIVEKGIYDIETAPVPFTHIVKTEGVQDLGVVEGTTDGTPVPVVRHSVFAVPADPNRYQMLFVNSMGYIESVNVFCLRSEESKSESTRYMRSLPETFGYPSGSIYVKKNQQESWSMSTGVIDEDWQAWFVNDVMMTRQAWIMVDGHWLPCHITGGDTVKKSDRSKNELPAVNFTVAFDLYGSVSGALTL